MSNWTNWEMERRIREALETAEIRRDQRALMSSFQIMISICTEDPDFLEMTGKKIGGEGIHHTHSLAVYVSRELTKRINDGRIDDIELFHLSEQHMDELEFIDHEGNEIEAVHSHLFRLKE